jgi:hypothetical protein
MKKNKKSQTNKSVPRCTTRTTPGFFYTTAAWKNFSFLLRFLLVYAVENANSRETVGGCKHSIICKLNRSATCERTHVRPSLRNCVQDCGGAWFWFVATNQRNSLVQFSCSIFIFQMLRLTPIFVACVLLTLQSSARRNQPVALKVSVMQK